MLLIDGEQTTRIFRLSHSVLGLSLSLFVWTRPSQTLLTTGRVLQFRRTPCAALLSFLGICALTRNSCSFSTTFLWGAPGFVSPYVGRVPLYCAVRSCALEPLDSYFDIPLLSQGRTSWSQYKAAGLMV